jgi:hypothetical protein
MERRKLIEYGIRPKPRDTHLILCDGSYCAREDCEAGKRWRERERKIIVDGQLRPARAE